MTRHACLADLRWQGSLGHSRKIPGPVAKPIWQQMMSTIDSLAIHFIRHGQWAEAVQLYRDEFGMSISQAERKVYGLASEYEIHEPKRLLLWLWVALGGFSIILLSIALSNYST